MIVTSFNLENPKRSILVVVIEKENLGRMQKGDPITLESKQQGGLMPTIPDPENMSLLIAYEEDDAELHRIAKTGSALQLLRYLERGRIWKPEVDGKGNAFFYKKEGN